jgi:Cdc6-like AAA superfamily ATPase
VQLKDLLDGFMRIQRRSEKAAPEILRKTFVDVGPLTTLLSITDNQTLFGRRGTGKTHVLQFLGSKQRENGDLSVYIDLSNLGSSGSIYSDTSRSIPERATRLLVDTLLAVHDSLLEAVLASDNLDLSHFGPVLDELAKAATRIQVVGNVETEAQTGLEQTENVSAKSSLGLTEKGVKLEGEFGGSNEQTQKQQFRKKLTGVETYVLHFGEISSALRSLEKLLGKRRLWVLLDEWSNLPLELQPYLGDLIRRTFFVMQNVTVKIAAIEYRSRFILSGENRSYLGYRVGGGRGNKCQSG